MEDLLQRTKEICRLFEINPQRSKGQNFLIIERVYDDIVKAAEINAADEVLEVGPGLGFLTVRLAKAAKRVVAVELDQALAAYLHTGFAAADEDKVTIVNQDILRFNVPAVLPGAYKIVANLPYNITSIFLRQSLTAANKPQLMVLMLQKEVAERITAVAPDMSLLALSVQYYADASIVRNVPAENFWPQPKVDSAIIKIAVRQEAWDPAEDKKFFRLARAGFSAKRKMLKNNLSGGLQIDQKIVAARLEEIGLSTRARAEELTLADWRRLFASLREFMV